MTFPNPNRQSDAKQVRDDATTLSTAVDFPDQIANTDPGTPFIFNFTKGMQHDPNGLLSDPSDYEAFIAGTEQHDPRVFDQVQPFRDKFLTEPNSAFDPLPMDGPYRQWESPTAGHAFVLEGPDPFALTMPPAPAAGSAEFAAEMAEVYQMALSRDWQIASFMDRGLIDGLQTITNGELAGPISRAAKTRLTGRNTDVADASTRLGQMGWFQGKPQPNDDLVVERRNRRRFSQANTPKGVSPSTLFRGEGEDGWATPFISQFMIMGTGGGGSDQAQLEGRASGRIAFGAQTIDQQVRIAVPHKDYMTSWADYVDIQNGLNKRPLVGAAGEEFLPGATRAMSTMRDLATYVHDDALYQAYLNAALILLGERFPLDKGIPYHDNSANGLSRAIREPFALFGGPHLLTLVTEVSSRALKAVRLQKFSVHRRLRPEAAGALFHTVYTGYEPHRELPNSAAYDEFGQSPSAKARRQLGSTVARYTFPNDDINAGTEPVLESILTDVRLHNAAQNNEDPNTLNIAKWLLPMAFPEGSPMHPAYGAGHATVAGACVTLLKAFFAMENPKEEGKPTFLVREGGVALVPDGPADPQGRDSTIDLLGVEIPEGLTLEGELNKLMWNISNGRNIAGVHYYTDYVESALLGEAITIGILREQMLAYHPDEQVSMTVPLLVERSLPDTLLNGSSIQSGQLVKAVRIRSDGTLEEAPATPGRTAP